MSARAIPSGSLTLMIGPLGVGSDTSVLDAGLGESRSPGLELGLCRYREREMVADIDVPLSASLDVTHAQGHVADTADRPPSVSS